MKPNQPVHRTEAHRFGSEVAKISKIGFATDARATAPVGDFSR